MSTLFISDLHLQEQRPDITRVFFQFLEQQASRAHQLYILGDLFEYWIGDDAANPYQRAVMDALKQLSRQVDLFYIHGNRDFLIGERFADATGMMLLTDPTLISLYGRGCLLLHGDLLCTEDQAYMAFRKQVRSQQWQTDFLQKPVAERVQIAQQLRDQSQQQTAAKDPTITDVTPAEVERCFKTYPCDLMIHGHTHRPAVHPLRMDQLNAERMVLGDWGETGWYIQADYGGIHLKKFVPQETATGTRLINEEF